MTVNGRDRGATLPIVALLLPVLILMTSFAVDLGRQRASRRTMQARADILALDLVRLADGRTLADIESGDLTHDSAAVALSDSASRNAIPVAQIDPLEWGTWSEASGFIATGVSTAIPNSVRVTTKETTDYFFRPGGGDVTRQAVAVKGLPPQAGFSIGSFGATIDVDQAGFISSIVSPILGNPAGVSALSYQGLATSTVGVGELGAELGLASPDEVFTTEVSAADMMLATAAILRRSGDPNDVASADVLDAMASTPETGALPPLSIGDMVAVTQGGESAALAGQLDALGIVQAAALLAQCSDPTDPATCSGLALPALSTTLPLTSTTGGLQLIQATQSAYGPIGTSAQNSQIIATLGSVVGAQSAGTCVPSLANLFCVLDGLLVDAVDASVTLNATVRLADGQGSISAIDCGDPLGLDILTTTGLYEVDLDVVVDFGRRGVLGGLLGPLIGSLHLQGSTDQSNTAQTISFDVPPDVYNVTTKEAGGGSVGLSTLALSTVGSTGVLGTLDTLGISMTTGTVVNTLVNPLLGVLDTQILGEVTTMLGINVVGADLTAQAIDCNEDLFALVG